MRMTKQKQREIVKRRCTSLCAPKHLARQRHLHRNLSKNVVDDTIYLTPHPSVHITRLWCGTGLTKLLLSCFVDSYAALVFVGNATLVDVYTKPLGNKSVHPFLCKVNI